MNAKKIMGAVLVALLAAALFVGAGAAAGPEDYDGKTVFVYQVYSDLKGSTWTNAAGESITFNEFGYLAGHGITEGKYSYNKDVSITVKYPTASISIVAEANGKTYDATNGVLYITADLEKLSFSINSAAPAVLMNEVLIITPSGEKKLSEILEEAYGAPTPISHNSYSATLNLEKDVDGEYIYYADGKIFDGIFGAETDTGLYKFIPVFTNNGAEGQLAAATPENLIASKAVATLDVKTSDDIGLVADVDSVVDGSFVTLTMTGVPGVEYDLDLTKYFTPYEVGLLDLEYWDEYKYYFTMPNTGKAMIKVQAAEVGDATIEFGDIYNDGETVTVEIEVLEGTITAKVDKESYYIGNDVTITGTANSESKVFFYIAGTNIGFTNFNNYEGLQQYASAAVKNGEFEKKIDGNIFRGLDAGTYTLYVASNNDANKVKELKTYATVALVLKQPFISVTDAPAVAVKGSKYVVTGTAEAAEEVLAYVFGTNFYASSNGNDLGYLPAFFESGDFNVNVKNNEFTIEIEIPQATENMSAGQYFMVIQHPMYDKAFNVAPMYTDNDEYPVIGMNTEYEVGSGDGTDQIVVDVFGRQKSNAAQALCDNLDSENIDDMYVKLSFVVGAPTSVINPIAEEVVKGEKLTVSGTTNMGKDVVVTVEMLSTAFAAVPKSTVGSASFISLVTKTDENGNWEVTFDTTGLNVDEYTVSAAVEQLGSSATAKVNVIEAAPVNPDTPDTPDVPDVPDTPDTPTEPETPGFGALAALAGLGAVAVLLLRRE